MYKIAYRLKLACKSFYPNYTDIFFEGKTLTLETSKNLGGVGAILMFIGVFPYINTFGIVELIGAILILAGLHGFADHYNERGIFNNAIYGFIAVIVGGIAAIAIAIAIILPNITDLLQKLYPAWNGNLGTLSQFTSQTPITTNLSISDILPFVSAAIVVFIIVWVFAIIAAIFFRRSLKLVSNKTTVGLFSTAGLLLVIGAGLIIVIGLGIILMWIATLILAIAFFTMKPRVEEQSVMTTTSPPTSV
jgi:uncharacterized membrane protein